MSWIRENSLGWAHKAVAGILKCGVIPKHVAFIMDGNRRFAKKANIEKFEGHTKGFDKLSETLQWCLDLGITEVTVYAFSIENFKRSKEEVDGLIELARSKFQRLLMEKDKLSEKGVCIHIIGDKSLLPEDIRHSIHEIEDMTKDNSKAFLNVAFSYTAQNEMTMGVNKILSGLSNGDITEDDLSLSLLSNSLYTAHSKPPDIIVRTSGEKRLSDFLLFQGCWSYIEFTDVLWPELSVWHLFWIIFKYQCLLRAQFNNKIESSQLLKSSDLIATPISS